MKTPAIFLLFFWMIFSGIQLSGQASDKEVKKEFYRSDPHINLIIYYLPSGWIFYEEEGSFNIQRSDSVLILQENRINAPYEKNEEREKRIKEYGRKTVASISLRYEKRWDFIKIQEINILNAAIKDEISKLPAKYGIEKLRDPVLSSKIETVYTPKNDTDKKNIESYYAEKSKLEKTIQQLPDFNSQEYSLFLVSTSGCNDDFHIVYPGEASLELYNILTLLREICGK